MSATDLLIELYTEPNLEHQHALYEQINFRSIISSDKVSCC